MLTLAIPLTHLAFLTGDPADGPVAEETLVARIRAQFGFLGAGVTVSLRDGVAQIALPSASAAPDDFAVEGTDNPALRRYARLAPEEVKQITLEAAILGREGLDYADAPKRYTLRALPGETFSGLELMCLMHAGCKRLAPGEDTGMNLDEPFLAALGMFENESRRT